MSEEKITAILILEILGKPAEHIIQTLAEIVENIGKEKNIKIIHKNIAEPKPVEGQTEVFTSFADIEIEADLFSLMLLVFKYMPSHIEIVEPEELRLKNTDLNLFFNELAKRLHQYDELTRVMMLQGQNLARQIQEGKFRVALVKDDKKKAQKKIKNKKKKK